MVSEQIPQDREAQPTQNNQQCDQDSQNRGMVEKRLRQTQGIKGESCIVEGRYSMEDGVECLIQSIEIHGGFQGPRKVYQGGTTHFQEQGIEDDLSQEFLGIEQTFFRHEVFDHSLMRDANPLFEKQCKKSRKGQDANAAQLNQGQEHALPFEGERRSHIDGAQPCNTSCRNRRKQCIREG